MKNKHILLVALLLSLFTDGRANKVYFNNLSVEDGLSQVNIYSIYQDETGALWFGSLEGINRYNGHSFANFHPSLQADGLTQNEIMAICGDKKGHVYIQALHDLVRYDIRKQTFSRMLANNVFNIDYHCDTLWVVTDKELQYRTDTDASFHTYATFPRPISAYTPLVVADAGIYIGTAEGLLLIPRSQSSQPQSLQPQSLQPRAVLPGVAVKCLYEDKQGNLWVGTGNKGVFKLSAGGGVENFTNLPGNPNSISNNQIRCMVEDDFGNLWVGTFYGLNRYTPSCGKWERFVHQKYDSHSLAHSSIFALHKDMQGGIWIGTYYGGVNYFNPASDYSNFYESNPDDPSTLSFPFVGMMAEDDHRNLWVCTEGGGLNYFDRTTRKFSRYATGEIQVPPTGQNNMKCLWYQPESGKLYIGTHNGGLVVLDTRTRQSHVLKHIPGQPHTLPNNVINTIQPHDGRLVISTQSGIVALNLASEAVEPLSPHPSVARMVDNHTYETFYIDSRRHLWLASGIGGVSRIDLATGKTDNYFYREGVPGCIGKFKVIHIFENHKGELFFSTSGSGLFRFHPGEQTFEPFTQENNLLYNNYCYYVAQTKTHELVVLHNRGISYLDTDAKKLLYIHRIPETSFCQGSAMLCTGDGELYLGGINGMLSLSDDSLLNERQSHSLYFDRLTVNNKVILPDDDSRILSHALSFTAEIRLQHDKNSLTIELGTSNFIRNKYKYEYRLRGFNESWLPLYANPISYTNLPPGEYELLVRQVNNDQSVCGEKSLKIIVSPPLYANVYAYLFYFLAGCIILFVIIRFNTRQAKLKASLLIERKEKEKIEELNQSKVRFFANISHEFRTPLTLILGQLEPLLQLNQLPPAIYNRMLRIYKNAGHLTTLISELLDIHKQEQGALKLKVEHRDIVGFAKEVYMLFYEHALKKHITYTFSSVQPDALLWFDPQQMQKVILNLLSNAFKYTREGGEIAVSVRMELQQVCISVSDTGTGIPPEAIHKIFERFYQLDGQTSQFSLGTGIGLALVKNIVELHHGSIQVNSRVGEGSCFTVQLHTGNAHFTPLEMQTETTPPLIADLDTLPLQEEIALPAPAGEPGSKPSILLVEDNEDILRMLVDIFTPVYEVHTARDGVQGLEATERLLPDLVLSDVMMPRMSGKKMCYKIKNSVNTSHIPVVLLTALSTVDYAVEGYMYGADDYITKPFSAKLLVSRCNNLVNNRRLLMEKFRSWQETVPVGNAVSEADKELLDKATAVIKQNYENQKFNMNDLAAQLGIGRNKLYARIRELTGLTPNELTLKLRLDESARLLDNHPELNISEISDRLGFSSTPYYSKCFKAVFGMSPLAYRKR